MGIKSLQKIAALAFTIFLLYLIYSKIDLKELEKNFVNLNVSYLLLAFSLFFILPLIKTYRWKLILGSELDVSYFKALKVLMAGSVFNLFVPSKLGDFSRLYFCQKELSIGKRRVFNSVIVEKICDVIALCVISLFSLGFADIGYTVKIAVLIFSLALFVILFVFINLDILKFRLLNLFFKKFEKLKIVVDDARNLLKEVKYNNIHFIKIVSVSLFFWQAVLFQIYLFFLVLNAKISFLIVVGLVPIALFVGMIPVTISGIGTRDAALIMLFSKFHPPEVMAGIGILCSLRSLIASMIGLPFFMAHSLSGKKKELDN